jgi:hypothetical protein
LTELLFGRVYETGMTFCEGFGFAVEGRRDHMVRQRETAERGHIVTEMVISAQ